MITGIFHAAISVLDMEKTLWFYCSVLGAEKMFVIEEPAGTPMIVSARFGDGTFLEFFYPKDITEIDLGKLRNHICLKTDDIFALEKILRVNGITITSAPKIVRDGNWQLWCVDPNGYRLEIMQLVPGCPQLQEQITCQVLV